MNREHRKYNKKEFEKVLLKKYFRYIKLGKMIYNLGYKELETPIRYGWEMKFVLRPDVAKHKSYKFYQQLLDLVNTTTTSRNKKFLRKNYKTKKYEPIEFHLTYIEKKKYKELNEKQQLYFDEYWEKDWRGVSQHYGYKLKHEWRYIPKRFPHYITRIPITDKEMEKERDELNSYFDHENLWPIIDKILGAKSYWKDDWWVMGRVGKYREELREYKKEYNGI